MMAGRLPTNPAVSRFLSAKEDTISTAGILLAAGRSIRMGGRSKLLRVFRGKPLVRWAAEALVASGLDQVVVVTGPEPELLREALRDLPVRIVENRHFQEGMSTSLKTGVAALEMSVTVAVVALGDMPLLSPELVRELLVAFNDSDKSIVVPVHAGRRGHPVVFDLRTHRNALACLAGDQGARTLLEARSGAVLEFSVNDPGVRLDVDTPEDLRNLERNASVPSPKEVL